MPKKFSEIVPIAPNLRHYEAERKYTILCAQLQKVKGTAAGLALLNELIDRLDGMIPMPPTRRIRLNSRQFSDFPLESADRREMIRLKTNQDIEVGSKWLPLLETKLALYAEQPAPAVTLHYLD